MSAHDALAYLARVQAALSPQPEAFRRFLSILSDIEHNPSDWRTLKESVSDVLAGHPELISHFDTLGRAGGGVPPPAKRIRLQSPATPPSASPPTASTAAGVVEVRPLAFWEQVRQHIADPSVYLEFLKLIHLYSQKVFDLPTFLHRAKAFLGGDPGLWEILVSLVSPSQVHVLERANPSYHFLYDESERRARCSGRDALCNDVLNDDWVAHPQWLTDGESLEPFRRNEFEDNLFRTEEERHELDFYLNCNRRTIAFLQSLSRHLDSLPRGESEFFKLPADSGAGNQAAYVTTIKKVYGAEFGPAVVEALYAHPARVIPTLLPRLQGKENEWRQAKADWNLVWKEVEARSSTRALDYQLPAFQAGEKKTLTSREMITEIEVRKAEHLRLQSDQRWHLCYAVKDRAVLIDTIRLTFALISHEWIMTKADTVKVKALFRNLLVSLFGLSANELDGLAWPEGESDSPQTDENPDCSPARCVQYTRTFYGTNKLYYLIRLLHLAYARLLKFKSLASGAEAIGVEDIAQRQIQLEAYTPPSIFSEGYDIVLNLSERWLTGRLNEEYFLESVRFLFPRDAYVLSTFDRLLGHIARVAQTIVVDNTSVSLLSLAWQDMDRKEYIQQCLALAAESVAGHVYSISSEEGQLGITLLSQSRREEDDARKDPVGLLGPPNLNEDEWLAYVRRYASPDPTFLGIEPPFLRRNVRWAKSYPSDRGVLKGDQLGTRYLHRPGLVFRVALVSYRLFFEPGSEDVFVRMRPDSLRTKPSRVTKENRLEAFLSAHLASKPS